LPPRLAPLAMQFISANFWENSRPNVEVCHDHGLHSGSLRWNLALLNLGEVLSLPGQGGQLLGSPGVVDLRLLGLHLEVALLNGCRARKEKCALGDSLVESTGHQPDPLDQLNLELAGVGSDGGVGVPMGGIILIVLAGALELDHHGQ